MSAGNKRFDVGILTVIKVELDAVKLALGINGLSEKIRTDGNIYFPVQVYSQNHNSNLSVIVGCIGNATNSEAAAATKAMRLHFNPAMMILVGIAGGWKEKHLRIGDVVIPRDILDMSGDEISHGEHIPRIKMCQPKPQVGQMLVNFDFNLNEFQAKVASLFGPPIVPPADKKALYEASVTYEPKVVDCVLATSNSLVKDENHFKTLAEFHPSVGAVEMEAGGFARACDTGARSIPWLVIRGISDHANELKDDNFHRLASIGAATYLHCFLTSGIDLHVVEHELVGNSGPISKTGLKETSLDGGGAIATNPTFLLLSDQLEKLSESISNTVREKIKSWQNAKMAGHGAESIADITKLKQSAEWVSMKPEVKSAVIKIETQINLAINKDPKKAATILEEAKKLFPQGNYNLQEAQIANRYGQAKQALSMIATPADIDEWNYRMAVLLQEGDFNEAITEYEKKPFKITSNDESVRIYALCLLCKGNVQKALDVIEPAVSRHPDWPYLSLAYAVILCASAVSPAVIHQFDPNHPMPINLDFILRTESSLTNLLEAEKKFDWLMKVPDFDKPMISLLQGWKLAAIGYHFGRQIDARQYCAELMAADPTHQYALQWNVNRGFNIEDAGSVDALLRKAGVEL